jgi:DNA repair exonuclease SbcCD ATPase subunit
MRPIVDLKQRVDSLRPRFAEVSKLQSDLKLRKQLIEDYRKLTPVAQLEVPESTPFPPDLGETVVFAHQLVKRWTLLKSLPELPEQTHYDTTINLASDWQGTIRNLKTLSSDRKNSIELVRRREAALSELTTELEQVEGELEQLMSELNVCPICDRPMLDQKDYNVVAQEA